MVEGISKEDLVNVMIKALVLFTAFPVHEFAHAWAANKLGDDTAKNQGRLTINPFVHIDWIGAIAMLIMGFGWAKPVPINPNNFKNRKVGMALSAAAGPLSNIIMALIALIVYKLVFYIMGNSIDLESFLDVFYYIVSLNIGLAVFNLLPIPPLDGSRISTLFLKEETYFKIMKYENIIFLALIFAIRMPFFQNGMNYLIISMIKFLNFITGFIDIIFS